MFKVTRVESFPEREEVFVNAECRDELGIFNFGKWFHGIAAVEEIVDAETAVTKMAELEEEMLGRRRAELAAREVAVESLREEGREEIRQQVREAAKLDRIDGPARKRLEEKGIL